MEKWLGIIFMVPFTILGIWISSKWFPTMQPFILNWVIGTGIGFVLTIVLVAIVMMFNRGD